MISKKQFCEMIVNNFCKDLKINKDQLKSSHCLQSSQLAVAMEFLGLLDNEMKDYAWSRGGVLFHYFDEQTKSQAILTARELLELLPEEDYNE